MRVQEVGRRAYARSRGRGKSVCAFKREGEECMRVREGEGRVYARSRGREKSVCAFKREGEECMRVREGEGRVYARSRGRGKSVCAFKREREECMRVQPSVMLHGSCVPTLSKQKKRFSFSNGAKISKKVEHTVAEMREEEQQQPENANSFTLGVSEGAGPEHLVVLVNGIVGSVENWRFAAEQFKKKLADKVVVHCSACNSALRTFNGVDVMGNRLAEEVQDVVDANPGLTKISFLSHSLGGLVSRYAIGQLYAPQGGRSLLQERASSRCRNGEILVEHTKVGEAKRVGDHDATTVAAPLYGSMAGLEPINFITVATPHLGSKGNRHVPFLFGISTLERVAPMISHWFIGRTGRHLFLADGNKTLQPLLQRMVTDCHEGRFMSALWAFKQRTAYANIVYDHIVGWRTASIRRESEMPQVDTLKALDPAYPHIVRDEELPAVDLKPATMQTREPASDFAEEVMLAGLQQVAWRRVDVSFLGARVKYQAHNTIQVKSAAVHLEGQDVIAHIIDKHF